MLLLAILPVPTTALSGIIMGSLMGTLDFFLEIDENHISIKLAPRLCCS